MRTLLLVDASLMMHRIVELTFAREDVRVIAVTDGEKALGVIAAERPDILLADHAAPGLNGYELATYVKSQPDLAHVPVLLLAGAFEPIDRERAAQVGSEGILVKPFEPQQVVERVRALLDAPSQQAAVTVTAPPPISRPTTLKLVDPVPRERPASQTPADRTVVPVRKDDLDGYFDQLDAALGSLGSFGDGPLREGTSPERPAGPERIELPASTDAVDVPTLDRLLGQERPVTREEPPMVDDPGQPPTEPIRFTARGYDVVQTDEAPERAPMDLAALATALGARLGAATPPTTAVSVSSPADALPSGIPSDDVIDEIARRVAQRLAPDAVSRVVSDIVVEVAERLVRAEIERLRPKPPGEP